ncbi:putative 26S proteasome regulatory subunit [Arachnomyces sp. PD_36]|nr:putative 26S proteasome regulatory subunit [Arachnomyces sp. PD_36]
MESMHAPTVASGPTATNGVRELDLSKLTLPGLIEEKERLEAELKALGSVLESHGVTMTTTLTTFDGYPRDDIDIPQIRTTRARIIPLRNDYKTVMNAIEKALHAHHALLQQNQENQQASGQETTSRSEEGKEETSSDPNGLIETPFAKVASVVDGSPASEAGLKAGDTIRNFGGVIWMNHENLSKVADVVQRNEGRVVVVKVVRQQDSGQPGELSLSLRPRRNWGGRGILGCHIVPL